MKVELQGGCRAIMKEYEKQINTIKLNDTNNLNEIEEGIRISKTFIHRLRVKVLEGCITSKEDEIYFFKHIKPTIMGDFLYYCYLKDITHNRPVCTIYVLQEFLEKKLEKFNHFLKKNYKCYAYYNSDGNKNLDECYFVRCYLETEDYNYHPYSMIDSDFATSKDYVFADFRAHEKVIIYIEEELIKLKIQKKKRFKSLEELISKSPFYWTDTKVALTEIIYAMAYSGSINHGNVDLKELAKYICLFFNIDNLDLYRTFIDIKGRKKNYPVYLDKVRDILISKIEDDLK